MAAEASNHTPTAGHALSDLDCVSHSGTLTGLPGLIGQPVLLERHQGDTAQRQVQPGPVAPTHPRDNFVHRSAPGLEPLPVPVPRFHRSEQLFAAGVPAVDATAGRSADALLEQHAAQVLLAHGLLLSLRQIGPPSMHGWRLNQAMLLSLKPSQQPFFRLRSDPSTPWEPARPDEGHPRDCDHPR